MAAKIKAEKGAEVEIVRGGGGVFDVLKDGTLIASKHQIGRFPEESEVLAAL